MQSNQAITHFHSFIIKGVTNLKTDKTGWRIVGIWGDEEKGEGNRIGPTFDEDQLAECEALADELEKTYGLPVLIKTIIAHFEPPASHTINKNMDELIECLKECNLKLDALRTADYRFVAWIIYSTQHGCFVAGVDTYSNDEQNLQYVAAKGIDISPIEAMNQVYRQICEWEKAGEVPVLSELFS